MKLKHHYILLGVMLTLAAVCGGLMPFVNVNSDMTKYLPKGSPMKQGYTIIQSEFGSADISSADVKVMFRGLEEAEISAMHDSLALKLEVSKCTHKISEDGAYTLYELTVDKSVDQKKFGKLIRKSLPKVDVVETSQDGATPPISVMVIAAVLIILILLIMCQSWVEPFIYLATTGLAILFNMGTNALLPSVSITTHSIAAILQLVLSLDYCIVLTNRYRQERKIRDSKVDAANAAIRRAFAPIMSSAMTTVVGLLMLCFMRLRIGIDMGVVLAKGVIFSLICTFTVMPSLLMMFQTAIERSHKRTFVIPTSRLGRFATSHKIPIAIFAVILFGVSFFFSQRTNIFFSANTESRIAKVFPPTNPFVVIYDSHEEDAIIPLADSIQQQSGVLSLISYPTLLKRAYNADEMAKYLTSMGEGLGDLMPAAEQTAMLTPELMRILYYMRTGEADTLTIGFPELTEFISDYCLDNPLFASVIDDEMRNQMQMLQEMTAMSAEDEPEEKKTEEKVETPAVLLQQEEVFTELDTVHTPVSAIESQPSSISTSTPLSEQNSNPAPRLAADPTYPIVSFINKLYAAQPSALTMDFRTLADTVTIHRIMGIEEMAAYIGSSVTQTRLVFNYDKGHRKAMTPIEYMHILTDDLFNRKALNGMITAEQKSLVRMRTSIMDLTIRDAQMTATQLSKLCEYFGISDVDAARVRQIMEPAAAETATRQLLSKPDVTALPAVRAESQIRTTMEPLQSMKPAETVIPTISQPGEADSAALAAEAAAHEAHLQHETLPAPEPVVVPAPVRHKQTAAEREADRKAALFLDLMYGGKRYSAAQMTDSFSRLGQPVDTTMTNLLYTYYGSVHLLPDSMVQTVEQVFNYVFDELVSDPRLDQFVDPSMKEGIIGAKSQIKEGVGMLSGEKHALLVILTSLPVESAETYAFCDELSRLTSEHLKNKTYTVGESAMYSEMKAGFGHEMMVVTILTILAIFLIVAITFRSVVVPTILVLTVMTAVYVNVCFCGLATGDMLYLAYLIVQSILMGATIDYGILFANYYKEKRKTMPAKEAVFEAYHGSIRTIMTSGLIMVVAPGAMSILTDNVMISNIVGCLAIGAFVAIVLILVVLPGVLVVFDRWIVRNAFSPKEQ